MKKLLKRELRRKSLHIFTGVVFILSALIAGDIQIMWIVGLVFFVPFLAYYLLLKFFEKSILGKRANELTEREGDEQKGLGGVAYVAGIFVLLVLHGLLGGPPALVLASVCVLTFGDGVSSYVGMRWGKNKFFMHGHKKTIEGTLAGLLASGLTASFFVPASVAWFGAIVAMIIELVGIRIRKKEIPDNFYLPVLAFIAMFSFVLVHSLLKNSFGGV